MTKYKVLRDFVGKVQGHPGESITIEDKEYADELIKHGIVKTYGAETDAHKAAAKLKKVVDTNEN